MNQNITKIIFFILGIFLIMCMMNQYSMHLNESCGKDQTEQFVDKYYHWNWNDPNMIKLINLIDNSSHCKDCTYSMSCDYTDDAQPFCYRSLDVPSYDKRNKVLRNNSI